MKNFLLKLLTIVFAFTLCLGVFSACGGNGGEPSHTHNYNILKYDENNHWYECKCGDIKDIINHSYNSSEICTTCNHINGLIVKLSKDGTYAIVTKYTGKAVELKIPSMYNGFPIRSIGDEAFRDCCSLTSIEIPSSIESIGLMAFYDCDSLTYNIKDGLKYLGNNDNKYLYLSCYSKLNSDIITATTVNIDDNCKIIGDNAFSSCFSLTSIEIPDSVTSIGTNAFSHCISLTSIEIPNSVTSIGDYAFSNCYKLTSVVIPNSVANIGSETFGVF